MASPVALPQIFKNALSAPILIDIIRCIATFFTKVNEFSSDIVSVGFNFGPDNFIGSRLFSVRSTASLSLFYLLGSEEMDPVIKYVENLSKVSRFDMIIMCLLQQRGLVCFHKTIFSHL